MKIKLRVPHQDLREFTLFQPNPAAAHAWASDLPVTNINSLVDLLDRAVGELNRFPLSPEARYEIMETLRPELEVALSNLSKRFLSQPLVLPEEPRKLAELGARLHTLASTAYTIVAIEAIQKRDTIKNTSPARLTCEAIQRALLFGGGGVLQSYQLYRSLPIHGWQALHQLYALAENQQLENLPIPNPLSGGSTIKSCYLQALLLGCCKPNQLRQSDLSALYRGLRDWSSLVRLDRELVADDLFLVDLDSNQPPLYHSLYRDEAGPSCRYIGTGPLVEHLKNLKAESGDRGVSLDQDNMLPVAILDHVVASLGSMSLRNFSRVKSSSTLSVCIGLSSTHYHVAGKRNFAVLLYGDKEIPADDVVLGNPFVASHSRDDQWQEANPAEEYIGHKGNDIDHQVTLDPLIKARVLKDEEFELLEDQRYQVHQVKPEDASPGGYCLEWNEQLPGDVRAGDIVGLKEDENDKWAIAVIRWLRQVENAGTRIGLELLSPRAIPYGARIHQKGGEKGPPMRVLLLPEIKLVGQPHTLVTPRAGFRERQKALLVNSQEQFSIQLTRQIAATGSFAQFEFKRIKELGDVLAENRDGQPGTDFDSVWSNI